MIYKGEGAGGDDAGLAEVLLVLVLLLLLLVLVLAGGHHLGSHGFGVPVLPGGLLLVLLVVVEVVVLLLRHGCCPVELPGQLQVYTKLASVA